MVDTTTKAYRWKRFREAVDGRQKCDGSCQYSKNCPLFSRNPTGDCDMKTERPEQKRRFFNLFVMGEDGLRDEFFESLFQFAGGVDMLDTKQGGAYIELLQKAHRMYYAGRKQETVDDRLEIVVNTSGGLREALPILLEEQEVDEDKETLLNSSIVDEIIDEIVDGKTRNKPSPEPIYNL